MKKRTLQNFNKLIIMKSQYKKFLILIFFKFLILGFVPTKIVPIGFKTEATGTLISHCHFLK